MGSCFTSRCVTVPQGAPLVTPEGKDCVLRNDGGITVPRGVSLAVGEDITAFARTPGGKGERQEGDDDVTAPRGASLVAADDRTIPINIQHKSMKRLKRIAHQSRTTTLMMRIQHHSSKCVLPFDNERPKSETMVLPQ